MHEVRRASDNELLGFVDVTEGTFRSLTVFGFPIATHHNEAEAIDHVRRVGLEFMAQRWELLDTDTGVAEIALITEANPTSVTLYLSAYPIPGAESVTLRAEEINADRWRLRPA